MHLPVGAKYISDATPTLVDSSDVTLLGRVSTDEPSSVESTPKQKKKSSDGSPRSSKLKHSSKPTSDDTSKDGKRLILKSLKHRLNSLLRDEEYCAKLNEK